MSAENAWRIAIEEAAECANAVMRTNRILCDPGWHVSRLDMPPAFRAEVEAEAEELRKEIADLKSWVIAFGAPWASSYGDQHFGPGMMHPDHYDIIERCGARMASFTRARLKAKGESHE